MGVVAIEDVLCPGIDVQVTAVHAATEGVAVEAVACGRPPDCPTCGCRGRRVYSRCRRRLADPGGGEQGVEVGVAEAAGLPAGLFGCVIRLRRRRALSFADGQLWVSVPALRHLLFAAKRSVARDPRRCHDTSAGVLRCTSLTGRSNE
jgi:hypothetical protein